jgi:hypothetical protein
VPRLVTIAPAELLESAKEGRLAISVVVGLQVMSTRTEPDMTTGPRGQDDSVRTAVLHGSERGSVMLGSLRCR